MTHPGDEETDRAVSRRVEHPTSADAGDESAYAAAASGQAPDPGAAPGATGGLPTDTGSGGDGGTADRAARDDRNDGEEPMRSE